MPRRTRMFIGEHLQPVFVHHGPVRHVFQPHAQLDDIFRRRTARFQDFPYIGEHLFTLLIHSFGYLPGVRIFSEDSAADQKWTHSARVRDRIDVLQARNFNAGAIAHSSSLASMARNPPWVFAAHGLDILSEQK